MSSPFARGPSILIDYDDGIADNQLHDASIRNGGFEELAVLSPKEPLGKFVYRDVRSWVNLTGNAGESFVGFGFAYQGMHSAIFGAPNDRSEPSTPGQPTGHIIEPRDVFSLSVWYRASGKFGKGTDSGDYGQAVLFALDGDKEIEIARFDLQDPAVTYTQYTGTTGAITRQHPALGKELYIKFMYIDVDTNAKGRIVFDAVTLTATR